MKCKYVKNFRLSITVEIVQAKLLMNKINAQLFVSAGLCKINKVFTTWADKTRRRCPAAATSSSFRIPIRFLCLLSF